MVAASMTAAAMLGTCVAASIPAQAVQQAAPAVVPVTSVGAKQKPPKKALRVMTVNLYLGGSLGSAIEAADMGIAEFLAAAAGVYDTAQATNFPLRAEAIAKSIKKRKPDIVALNELTDWVASSSSGANLPNYDYLKILKRAMKKQGLAYKNAAIVDNADIGFTESIGIPYLNPARPGCDYQVDPNLPLTSQLGAGLLNCQVRLKDRDGILYNTKTKKLKFLGKSKTATGRFKRQQEFAVAGQQLSFDRGWASAQFSFRGKKFTMMTSHLEVESGTPGTTGLKNWPSPVQVAQGKQLVRIAQKKAKQTNGRVVLAGDLNSDANGFYSPTYRNLTKYFKDSYLQAGGEKGQSVGATCCQTGDLNSDIPLDSGDPVVPTRIDLVLNRKAKAVWAEVIENKLQDTQPMWESDHYFYAAAVRLK